MKRKASRSLGSERPSKLGKKNTSTTVSRTLSSLHRSSSTRRPPLTMPRFPTLKPTGPLPNIATDGGFAPTPALRRAPTVTLREGESDTTGSSSAPARASSRAPSRAVSKTPSRLPSVPSLKKTTSKVEGDDVITSVVRLPSGSSIGKTTSFSAAPTEVRKELSRTGSVKSVASVRKSASIKEAKRAVDGGETTEDADDGSSLPLPLPPGGLVEIVFSFDTTGSMNQVLDEVRGRVQDMIQRLQADIPSIRIAVVAHGDYCDKDTYVTKWIDFGASTPELCNFVKTIEKTGGGDFDECYELVLRQTQEELSWTPGSQRSLVMIGDATPHPPDNYQNELKIDWKEEVTKLSAMGVKIYAVQALDRSESKHFYKTMASKTGGRHLKLSQFSNVFDIIMAICYCEHGFEFLDAYEDEVRERHGGGALHKDLEGVFDALRDSAAPVKKTVAPKAPTAKGAKKGSKPAAAIATKKALAIKGKTKSPGPRAKPKPKKGKKGAQKGKGKQRRETVAEKAFLKGPLRRLRWTPWRHALSATNQSAAKQIWRSRASLSKSTLPGWRRFNVFNGNEASNCLYEVALTSGSSKRPRKYVMHYVPAQKLRSDVISNFLRSKSAAREVDALLKVAPADIFVRCGIFKTTRSDFFRKVLKYLRDNFDYAWRSKPRRLVKKAGRVLSGNA